MTDLVAHPASSANSLTAFPDASALLDRPLGQVVMATLQAAARSDHSRRAYRTGIGYFLQFLGGALDNAVPAEWRPLAEPTSEGRRTVWAYRGSAAVLRLVQPGHLDGFRAWREAQGDSPNSVAKHAAAASTFLRVAYRDGILSTEQAMRMGLQPYKARQKRDRKPVGRRLSKEEARALRAAPDLATTKGQRDRALLDLMLFLGLRAEEVATLRLDAFRQDNGRWWLHVTGKGRKTRRLKLHDEAYTSLSAWLVVSGSELGQKGAVFVSVNKGDRIRGRDGISSSVVSRIVAEYGEAAGLAPLHGTSRLSPHDLRRTAARNAFDNGANLLQVQAMLGHADPSTTAQYIGAYERDEDTAVDYVRY